MSTEAAVGKYVLEVGLSAASSAQFASPAAPRSGRGRLGAKGVEDGAARAR
jgi:hypothetical protein